MIKKSARKLDRRIKSKEGKSTATSRKLNELLKKNEPQATPAITPPEDILAPFNALPDTFHCPESSNIWGAGYDPETHKMQVVFKSGKDAGPRSCYEYDLDKPKKDTKIVDIPSADELWDGFKAIRDSKGKYFAACIRPVFEGRQLWVIQ